MVLQLRLQLPQAVPLYMYGTHYDMSYGTRMYLSGCFFVCHHAPNKTAQVQARTLTLWAPLPRTYPDTGHGSAPTNTRTRQLIAVARVIVTCAAPPQRGLEPRRTGVVVPQPLPTLFRR